MATPRNHDKTFETVKAVIDHWDPYGLLDTGAPDDEFSAEVECIVADLGKAERSPESAACLVSEVFSRFFVSEDFPLDECREVGRDLHDTLHAGTRSET